MSEIAKIERAKIFKINDLLEYKIQQIISTQLVENSLFSLDLYSFAKDESINPHSLLDPLLVYVLEGDFMISNQRVKANQSIFFDVGDDFSIKANENSKAFFYSFKKNVFKNHKYNKNINFKEYISYVENAVSSKVFVQEKELSLTLIAMSKDESLKTHAASGDAIVIALEGKVLIKIDEKEYEVKEGELIILPKNIPHSLLALKDYKMFLSVVR